MPPEAPATMALTILLSLWLEWCGGVAWVDEAQETRKTRGLEREQVDLG